MKRKENIQGLLPLEPDYVGFIFYPGSKRYVDTMDTRWLQTFSRPKKTGVFVNSDPLTIGEHITRFGLQAVQLHGMENPATCAQIRAMGVETIKAFGINEHFDWKILTAYDDVVDYFLFDTKTAGHGGSGHTFDWSLLSGYKLDKPYFLSGGLELSNLHDAVALTDERLFALDLNSRFESEPGIKDITLLKKAFQIIKHE